MPIIYIIATLIWSSLSSLQQKSIKYIYSHLLKNVLHSLNVSLRQYQTEAGKTRESIIIFMVSVRSVFSGGKESYHVFLNANRHIAHFQLMLKDTAHCQSMITDTQHTFKDITDTQHTFRDINNTQSFISNLVGDYGQQVCG